MKLDRDSGAPALEARPGGCHVDIFEDGQKVTRPHVDIGRIVLDWPRDKLKEQGPDGAMKTLREAACENGAFLITNLRGLPTADQGIVYDGTLATLVGADGKPVNPKADAPAHRPAPSSPPVASGW